MKHKHTGSRRNRKVDQEVTDCQEEYERAVTEFESLLEENADLARRLLECRTRVLKAAHELAYVVIGNADYGNVPD